MNAPTCACGKPSVDAAICPACTDQLGRDLAAIPWLSLQLGLSLSRQTASGRQDGGRSADKPLPYDVGASDALQILGTRLREWAPRTGDRPVVHGPFCRIGLQGWCMHSSCIHMAGLAELSLDQLAQVIGERLGKVRLHPKAGDAVRDIGGAVAKARRTIDRRPDQWFAGPCDGNGWSMRGQGAPEAGCGDWLYCRPNAADVKCKGCTTVYDVVMRRRWMLEAAEDYLCHASLLSNALTRMGKPVRENTLNQWHARHLIERRGKDAEGRHLYRVGDVLDRLAGEAARHAVTASSNGG